jgi:long-subunit acyl-CoA synthetase (AMP-forming)
MLYLISSVPVKQGWGMTETTCSNTGFTPNDEDDCRSIGWLNHNSAARIKPLDDREFSHVAFPDVTVGEIWVAGPNVMKAY